MDQKYDTGNAIVRKDVEILRPGLQQCKTLEVVDSDIQDWQIMYCIELYCWCNWEVNMCDVDLLAGVHSLMMWKSQWGMILWTQCEMKLRTQELCGSWQGNSKTIENMRVKSTWNDLENYVWKISGTNAWTQNHESWEHMCNLEFYESARVCVHMYAIHVAWWAVGN